MNRIASVVAGLSLAFVGTSATTAGTAGTINVPGDQPTIAAAISASVNGGVITIAAGTYNEADLNPGGKAITIQGTINGDGSLATIIDAQGVGRVFDISSGEGAETVIQNLTITGGWSNAGGGIGCWGTSPTIRGCTISGNSANFGAAIGCFENSNPIISGCTITNNSAQFAIGGGIHCWDSSPTITDCTISGNTATIGGGIDCRDSSNPFISGCTISGNSATELGGGIACRRNSSPTISNCTVTGNTAKNPLSPEFLLGGGGIGVSNIPPSDGSNPTVNGGRVCGNIPDQIFGPFTFGQPGPDIASFCPETTGDLDGDGDYDADDARIAMANFGIIEGSESVPGDFDGDDDLDSEDYLLIVDQLGICTADLNGDGVVDGIDLATVLGAWGLPCDG